MSRKRKRVEETVTPASSSSSSSSSPSKPPGSTSSSSGTNSSGEDPLREVLFPTSKEARAQVFEIARQWLDKLDQVYPKLKPMCADTYRRALEFDDLDFAHFIFFLCIPQIKPLVDDLKASISGDRYLCFVTYLTRCRTNLIDGLTSTQEKCMHASQVHFPTLRHFVWDVRSYYLRGSNRLPTTATSTVTATTPAPLVPARPSALWNHVEAYRFLHVGDAYFMIMALILQNALCEEYSNHPFAKKTKYVTANVETNVERLTGSESSRRAVDPVAHARTLFRDMPKSANEWHSLRLRISRPQTTATDPSSLPILLTSRTTL